MSFFHAVQYKVKLFLCYRHSGTARISDSRKVDHFVLQIWLNHLRLGRELFLHWPDDQKLDHNLQPGYRCQRTVQEEELCSVDLVVLVGAAFDDNVRHSNLYLGS